MSSSRVGGVLEGGVGPGMLGGARMPVVLELWGFCALERCRWCQKE